MLVINEILFTHLNGDQVLAIIDIETTTENFRIDIIKDRNANNIGKFIKKFPQFLCSLITDGCSGYSCLDRQNSNYIHIVHSHDAGDFCYGDESTSHIESLCFSLKYLIKEKYNMIPICIY